MAKLGLKGSSLWHVLAMVIKGMWLALGGVGGVTCFGPRPSIPSSHLRVGLLVPPGLLAVSAWLGVTTHCAALLGWWD